MEYLITILVFIIIVFLGYMSAHLVEEQKQGRKIPLPWEKNND